MGRKLEMDRERWRAASPYLDQALELQPEQRDSWLRELESREPLVAADVRQLLDSRAAEPYASFLVGQLAALPEEVHYAHPRELIGSYRVLRELGRGGMAVVYLAERADGHFEQRVALKILRFGADGGEARRHFAQERQILASLNHPAIARLIDGGITATGLPYLAMEYVEGLPIDRYCDEHRLSIEDRLRLFVKVAEAVQHAHRHLIVHRDLKPSNIVIGPEGALKLLDFGIAKLLKPETMSHAAPPTRDVVHLMTPEYASPEQARGDPISTATDIYQLGVLLYELLTGRAPYDLRGRQSLDVLRVICESEPVRPSSAVTQPRAAVGEHATNQESGRAASVAAISASRATTPKRLSRLLRGDLEAIVLTALRKEPEHRYNSVGRLVDDVQHYLQGLPVSAYKGVWAYRAVKFIRRHATAVVISSAAVCAFAFVIVWYTLQLANERDRAESEAQRARREAVTASEMSKFLGSVFRGSSSAVAKGDTTARELLDRGAERIDTELAGQPEVQGRLLNVIGDVYAQYEIVDKAQALLGRALQLNTKLFGERSLEVADSKHALGRVAFRSGDFDKARQLLEETLQIRERSLGPHHVETAAALHGLANVLYQFGETQETVRISERATDIYTRSVGEDDEKTLGSMTMLALALMESGELTRARAAYEQLVPKIERRLGSEHPYLAAALGNLASVKLELGEYEGVEPYLRRSMEMIERLYGPDHGYNAVNLINLGLLHRETGRLHEAIKMLERTIALQRRVSGPGHSVEVSAQNQLGLVFHARGDLEAALSHLRSALEIRRGSVEHTWRHAMVLLDYAQLQMEAGHLQSAAADLHKVVSTLRRGLPAKHYHIAQALVVQGVLLTRTGKPAEAEAQIREAISYYQEKLPPEHYLRTSAHGALGESLLAQGRVSEAEPLLLDSAEQLKNRLLPERRVSLRRLIQLYERKRDRQSADRYRSELAAFERKVRE